MRLTWIFFSPSTTDSPKDTFRILQSVSHTFTEIFCGDGQAKDDEEYVGLMSAAGLRGEVYCTLERSFFLPSADSPEGPIKLL